MNNYNSQLEYVKEIFDKWSKDLQLMPEGEDKEKFRSEIKKVVDRFYGTIQIESTYKDS